jgi:chromosomal replication initiator protein
VSTELDHIWSLVQAKLAETVDEPVRRIWLEPLTAAQLDGGQLIVECPPHSCGWVRERFGRLLQACAAAVIGPHVTVDVVPAERSRPGQASTAVPASPATRRATRRAGSSRPTEEARAAHKGPARANPKLTFDQFVIGDCNRLAHAAALTVSELPAQAYNPLFICGPPGVGKTHLLHAIATLIAAHNPGLAVRSTSGEAFTNEFLQALGGGELDAFKTGFRHVDVLLIDDVQFLERKARTEEEFFHTFNALYDAGSQLVLTSDRPPADLQALEDRLRERFQAGLVADIRPPDMATRMGILRKRAQHDGLGLGDESVLRAIAERVSHNVRALEGALIRVVAYSSLKDRPLSPELACEVLDGLYPAPRPVRCSIEDIKLAACEHFGLSADELVSADRRARVAWPRQVAMFLAREMTSESLPAIGRAFGGRDHTTVLYAWRSAQKRMQTNAISRAAVDNVRQRLGSRP